MGSGRGVEARENSIRIHFTYCGKACKETLKTDGEPMAPTPANLKYAMRLAAEIREKIKHDSFVYADYFPDSARATTGQGITVGDHLENWIKLQTSLEDSTIKAYRVAVNWWKSKIGGITLRFLKHSDILTALASEPEWTAKTRNNKASVLRRALALAIKDGTIKSNPIDGLESAAHQSPVPDPFSLDEVNAILDYMAKMYDPQIANYFEFKFFAGPRTGESLAVRWENIDFRRRHVQISDTVTLGKHKASTKTHRVRLVDLNSRALAAIQRQKQHTLLLDGGWVFRDPKTGERWADDWSPRRVYWAPTLKKLGIRYRGPYNTRHTYATILLMSDAAVAYAAGQLGHSVQMFLKTYAKWLDGARNQLEMSKVNRLLGGEFPQNFPEVSEKR